MSRENATGWVALTVLASVIGMSALIRWSPPGPAVTPAWLESRSLPLLALPAALTSADDATVPAARNARNAPNVPNAPNALNVPNGPNDSNVPNTPNGPSAANVPNAPNVPSVSADPGSPVPLAAHHLSLPFSANANVADAAGPVERAFVAAGRGISGGFRSAGAAMRNAF